MFNRKTVFVLGAGASWHYGYPTGEELVRKITIVAEKLGAFFGDCGTRPVQPYPKFIQEGDIDNRSSAPASIREPWHWAQLKCLDLAKRLNVVKPLVIDYFLGQNASIQDVGKLLICWVILECEELFLHHQANPNRKELLERSPFQRERQDAVGLDVTAYKDKWCRFVLHKLMTGCSVSTDLSRNIVSFVTFNYDVSLEHSLYHGLNANDIFHHTDVDAFMAYPRIIHCYGKVRDSIDPVSLPITFSSFFEPPPPKAPSHAISVQRYYEDRLQLLDKVYEASKRLSTIDPMDKVSNADFMAVARENIRMADVVYVLGYGWDENNTDRIGLSEVLKGPRPKNVMFTNFGDVNRVNKKAGRAMMGNFSAFLPGTLPLRTFSPSGYVEKSVRSVYDALELDFDELEDG